jgi:hypothetical protein
MESGKFPVSRFENPENRCISLGRTPKTRILRPRPLICSHVWCRSFGVGRGDLGRWALGLGLREVGLHIKLLIHPH